MIAFNFINDDLYTICLVSRTTQHFIRIYGKSKNMYKIERNFLQLQFKIIALYPIRAGCTRIFNKKVNVLNEQGL